MKTTGLPSTLACTSFLGPHVALDTGLKSKQDVSGINRLAAMEVDGNINEGSPRDHCCSLGSLVNLRYLWTEIPSLRAYFKA